MTTINWQNYERSKLKLFFKTNDKVTVWMAGTFGQGQRYLEWIRKVSEGRANCSSSPPPNHCCAPYPLVHPTSIPLQFLSTFCSPLKEIGFKPWHKLAPQIDLILPHPGDIPQKRRPTFSPLLSFQPVFYISCSCPLCPVSFHFFKSSTPPPSLISPFLILSIFHLILCFPVRASLSVSCLSDIPPTPSLWWTDADGFW